MAKYTDGKHIYENIDGQIYKDGRLIPEENYKYIPEIAGGSFVNPIAAKVNEYNIGGQNQTSYQIGNHSFDEGSYKKLVAGDPYMTNLLASNGASAGGGGGGGSSQSSNNDAIKRMFDEQKQAQLAQLRQAIAKSKSQYQGQLDQSGTTFNALKKQTAASHYNAQQALREALANQGNFSGGQGRQERLQAGTAMANDLNAINLQQTGYENEIRKAISDLENSASLEELRIASDNASQLMQALINDSYRTADQAYQREQDMYNRNLVADELAYARSQDLASQLGYINPYAQYTITPDIQAQLAPYANDYAAFIQANPNSPLVPYARNARFQKMLASGDRFADELSKYRAPGYQDSQLQNQLQNQLIQAQIRAQNALANQRNTPDPVSTPQPNYTALNNAAQRAQTEINNINQQRAINVQEPLTPAEEQAILNKWLQYFGLSTGGSAQNVLSDDDILDYLK